MKKLTGGGDEEENWNINAAALVTTPHSQIKSQPFHNLFFLAFVDFYCVHKINFIYFRGSNKKLNCVHSLFVNECGYLLLLGPPSFTLMVEWMELQQRLEFVNFKGFISLYTTNPQPEQSLNRVSVCCWRQHRRTDGWAEWGGGGDEMRWALMGRRRYW